MIPDVVPHLAASSGPAPAGRPVAVATAMTGSVALGLIGDEAIHRLHRFRGVVAEPPEERAHA